MKTIYTLHHSANQEETFPTIEQLRQFVRDPRNEHLLTGAKADRRTIQNGESSESEPVNLAKLIV